MTKQRIVVALGGNAILTKDPTAKAQRQAVQKTAQALINFVKNGDELVVTHGNGPQVGNLLLQQLNSNSAQNPAMPLDTVGAMTQGSIGYWLQNALQEQLANNAITKSVLTIVTQTIVASDDPAFEHLSKPIGPFYTKEQLTDIQNKYPNWTLVEDAGRGYRRVVASPKPQRIQEAAAIKQVVDAGMIPIVSGGGGIPVVVKGDQLIGQEAVIDKDFSAAKVAELVDADRLLILTSVSNVFRHYGTADQQALTQVKVKELQKYIAQKEFAAGSMLPKVQAALDFVQHSGKEAVIGSLADVTQIIAGRAGTIIQPD
ncbi:carbamate kinase [Bombilactobacillus thymidiniphilus]|uniref:Carbamate kinase n=1 Tax=Bombilactobacillus thymidiniphilus TaxID=2923363 RepID=A0ABY4PB62_9LACO|nr:carbamate kinase [Bombilactobacillus thymidiniphilus]UQS83000.1 carbamate kinase [Bombilactobacillus thymidiniphilus]